MVGSILQLKSTVSYAGRLVRKVLAGLSPAVKKNLATMQIRLLSPNPTSVVCNEVRAHYKSNKMSEFGGSLLLQLPFSLHDYIQQPQGQTKPSNADVESPSPIWGLALGHQQLLIFALRSEKPEPEPPPSTTKSIPSPALLMLCLT